MSITIGGVQAKLLKINFNKSNDISKPEGKPAGGSETSHTPKIKWPSHIYLRNPKLPKLDFFREPLCQGSLNAPGKFRGS